jgi:major vault protein
MPDPRNEVIVRRILSDKQCELLFPGNQEALAYNRSLRNVQTEAPDDLASNAAASGIVLEAAISDASLSRSREVADYGSTRGGTRKSFSRAPVKEQFTGDRFNRPTQYSPPRTITLDTKYDGAVRTDIWPGFAIQVVNQNGERRVVEGPAAVVLRYDEFPETLALSTGKPKNNNGKLKLTAFLQVRGNKVTDLVELTTKDLVNVKLKVKYRVHFEGRKDKWFAVSNYVQLLCDHANSRLKAAARKFTIHELRTNLTEGVREVILGPKGDGGERVGLKFEENNMRVFDVEVLDLVVDDAVVRDLMVDAQHGAIQKEIAVERAEAELRVSTREHEVQRALARQQAETDQENFAIRAMRDKMEFDVQQKSLENDSQLSAQRREMELSNQEALNLVNTKRLETDRETHEFRMQKAQEEQVMNISMLEAKVSAAKEAAAAWSPQLVQAIETATGRKFLGDLAEGFSELAAVEGRGLLSTAQKFLDFVPTHMVPTLRKNVESDER